MSFVASGAILAGTALVGSYMQSNAAESAAQTQANAANNAAQVGWNEFNTITQQEQPFMQGGYGALSALDYGLGIGSPYASMPNTGTSMGPGTPTQPGVDPSSGFRMGPGGQISRLIPGGAPPASPANSGALPAGGIGSGTGLGFGSLVKPFGLSDFYNYSPAYQFQKQQGGQGVLNADTAGQGALSGAAMKDLISFNQGLAGTSFNNAFNQYQTQQGNIFNRLSGIAQLGQAAAANTGQQGTALSGQIGQSISNAGSALAAGQVGSANAWAGGLSNVAPWLMSGSNSPWWGSGNSGGGAANEAVG